MDEEMKLTTTTDQFSQDEKLMRNDQYLVQWHYARISRRKNKCLHHDQKSESFVKSNLWLMVNPNLACPIKYMKRSVYMPAVSKGPVHPQGPCRAAAYPACSRLCPLAVTGPSCHAQRLHVTSETAGFMLGDEGNPTLLDIPLYRKAPSRRKARIVNDKRRLKMGGWPRPPVNYCVLIAMALSTSHTGSLNVQQIYNFTREHFPFFQTAPDGWKNTIRHNLCFSSSFRKTPYQLCREGKRKSCLWHLTLDGRHRLGDEIRTLTEELFQELKGSMSYPDVIHTLLL